MLRGWTASANVLPGGSLRRINGLYRSVSADFRGIVARPRIFPILPDTFLCIPRRRPYMRAVFQS
jgi:hypothetical protein